MGLYAGFWKRFAASILDSIITLIGFAVVGFIMGATNTVKLAPLVNILSLVVGWLYYALMESSNSQATLGKMAVGIKVTDTEGNRIGFGKATGRYFGKIVSSLILLIGYLMAAFTSRKQALHDFMAGTLVVNAGVTPEILATPDASFQSKGLPGWAIALIVLGCLVPVIGILAAIAIPAYQDYVNRATIYSGLAAAKPAENAVGAFVAKTDRWPTSLEEAGAPADGGVGSKIHMTLRDNGVIAVQFSGSYALKAGALLLSPDREGDQVQWTCSGEGLKVRDLPKTCR